VAMTKYWTYPSSHPDYVSEAPDPGSVDDRNEDEGELMPKTSEMRESKFLKQTDIGAGMLMTVSGCDRHNVAKEGADPELKWCLAFEESDKPLVLNSINIQLLEQIFASDDTDKWIGKRVVLYVDPTVAFQGKVVGGIRVRAPKKAAAKPAPKPVVVDMDDDGDQIPF
jgi:hypothetical protein